MSGNTVAFPTPGHSKRDRGTVATLDPNAPDGLLVHSFNGGDPLAIKDELRARGMLPERERGEGWRLAGTYEYADETGTLLYRTVRKEMPGGRKRFVAQRRLGKGWANGLADTKRVLYRFPELLAADPNAPVYLVEGERKADKLAGWGFPATAIAFGAKGWHPRHRYAEALAGRTVVILPDNDDPGREFAQTVCAAIEAAGGTAHIVELPGLPPKGDVIDWIGSADELRALTQSVLNRPSANSRVELVRGDALQIEPVDWLWPGWLAAGKLHILAGRPGTGKTTIALALAAAITSGGTWPDGSPAGKGSVVIWSGEDDPADTLAPRLWVAGADMARVHIVRGVSDGQGGLRGFDPAGDTAGLSTALAQVPDVRLLIIDPLVSAVAGDSHKNAEVRRGLQPLVDIAHMRKCALLGISHFTKGTLGSDPLDRVTGSLAFGALARLVMVAAKAEAKDGEQTQRLLARAKSNIGPDGGGFIYDLRQDELQGFRGVVATRVQWGAALDGTARELLAGVEAQGEEANERRGAANWLRDLLADGPLPAREVKRHADEAGHAWRTVQRAMQTAGVVSERGGFGKPAAWRLGDSRAKIAPDRLCGATGATDRPG
ncbi:MAG: AAA family ATPase [Alphaproteobacteria bacterium]|nr:AAA family ATPase [Alphaproteobacteria bacterium]MBU0794810.1 AAA family ATPase [Alphaproteobacteria bacterium]MBU0876195.1 AAA family ATPase [Alphaproteobacteria bacterium]MBU1768716.1 AAA family ATPase [Alphaproteobacteria bacterium]